MGELLHTERAPHPQGIRYEGRRRGASAQCLRQRARLFSSALARSHPRRSIFSPRFLAIFSPSCAGLSCSARKSSPTDPGSVVTMLFNIEADRGSHIVGYLVPDDFTKSPTLQIREAGVRVADLLCEEERPSLIAAGRHGTGRCGFTINESMVPNLAQNDTVELYDAETEILIYRRQQTADVTQERIFRFETHLFPLWRLDECAEHRFQFFHKGVDRHGRETATQMLQLNNATSIYLSGRVAFKA